MLKLIFFFILLFSFFPEDAAGITDEDLSPGFKKDILESENQKQPDTPQRVFTYGTMIQAGGGTAGEMPFWLHSNRFGSLDRYSQNSSLHLFGSWKETIFDRLVLSVHFDLLLRDAHQSNAWFQEAYVQGEYAGFVFFAGRKIEHYGLVHPMLSSGTMDLSHNARPMPKVVFSTKDFRPVPFTRRVFYYDASVAHGWFDDNSYRFTDDVLLHQKHLYIRMFSEDAPIVPRAGLKHFAQWGGFSPLTGQAPVNFRSYIDVFFSLASDSKEILPGGKTSNHFQNHIGTYDFALMLNLGSYRISLSRQFILEDTPNARFGTPWDGMWGAYIELRPDSRTRWRSDRPADWRTEHRPLLKAVHYEYLDTKEGIGRFPHRTMSNYFDYYNHWAYRGGWTYHGRVLGNPLFSGDPEYYGVVNNILIGHHVSMMGYAGPIDWRFFTTYSRNYGSGLITEKNSGDRLRGLTERRDQWSVMLELSSYLFSGGTSYFSETGTLKNKTKNSFTRPVRLTLSLAYDFGELYPQNFGILVGFRWEGKRNR
ncbi:capsule assembly Wzi family protein [Balneolaceae bacterium ANBcel3]|nr:capsule assembly Wzi family protein [Balneolaceae bacterium ANBcel3]